MIKQLRRLSKGWVWPWEVYDGICELIKGPQQHVSKAMCLMRKWPKYSGDPLYPVPHPTKDPGVAFRKAGNLWSTWRWDKADRQYAKNRRELCAYLAYRLEND